LAGHATVADNLTDVIKSVFGSSAAAISSLGRVAAGADATTLAFTLVASAHHLFVTQVARR